MRWLLMFVLLAAGSCLSGCVGKRITFGAVDPTPLAEVSTGDLKIAEGKWIDWASLRMTFRMPSVSIEDACEKPDAGPTGHVDEGG